MEMAAESARAFSIDPSVLRIMDISILLLERQLESTSHQPYATVNGSIERGGW
jgi:hypothetical protein